MMRTILLVAVFMLCGCRSSPSQVSSAARLSAFFIKQQECNDFIYGIANHALNQMANFQKVTEMRSWLQHHPDDSFARLVLRVQDTTNKFGILYPNNKADQIKVSSALYDVLHGDRLSGAQSCDVDVGEFMAERMYFGVHGKNAPVFVHLQEKGIHGSSEQRRAFLTALMAGQIPPGW